MFRYLSSALAIVGVRLDLDDERYLTIDIRYIFGAIYSFVLALVLAT